MGLMFTAGFSYSDSAGWRVMPGLAYSHREFLSKTLAIEINPSFTPDIPFQAGEDFRWSAGLNVGPLFQLADTFSLKPAAGISVASGRANSGTPFVSSGSIELSSETTAALSLEVSAVWSIARQWDFRPQYYYAGLGSSTDFSAHVGIVEFVHFW